MNDIHALAGAYVLDAVDDVERAAFARHLAECPSCVAEVDELRETAARLTDATWSAPPPRLRATVLARIADTRQERPGHRTGRSVRRTGSRWRRVTAAAVAAGILAAGAGAVTYAVQEQRVRDQRAATVAARADAERLRTVLGAPDATVARGALAGGGQLTVVTSAGQDAGVVLLAGAAPIPTGRAYQLWLIDGATPRSAGVLPAGATDATRLVAGVRGKGAVAVTVEPAAGSVLPTTTPLAVVQLT